MQIKHKTEIIVGSVLANKRMVQASHTDTSTVHKSAQSIQVDTLVPHGIDLSGHTGTTWGRPEWTHWYHMGTHTHKDRQTHKHVDSAA